METKEELVEQEEKPEEKQVSKSVVVRVPVLSGGASIVKNGGKK